LLILVILTNLRIASQLRENTTTITSLNSNMHLSIFYFFSFFSIINDAILTINDIALETKEFIDFKLFS
jgi:hypothetical protein